MKKKFFFVLTFLLLLGIVGCGQKLSVSFKTDIPKEIAFDTPFDVGAYLVLEDGVSYEVRAEYQADGETKNYEIVDFVFTPTEFGEVTVTVVAKKDKAEAEGTVKLIVIDKPPVIKSVPQNLVHRLHDTIDLSEIEIEIESKSAHTLVWKSVKTPSTEVELVAEVYEFQESGTHEFGFKVTNLGGTASGKIIVSVTESDLTVSIKKEVLEFERDDETYDLLENLVINLTENIDVGFKISGQKHDGSSSEPFILDGVEATEGKLSLKEHANYTVAYEVTDTEHDFTISGNFVVNVSDKSVPVILEIAAKEVFEGTVSFEHLLEEVEVSDEYHAGFSLTVSIKDDEGNSVEVVDNSALLLPGTYVVTITANDGFGNEGSLDVIYHSQGPDEGDFFVRSRTTQASFYQGRPSNFTDTGEISYTTVTARSGSQSALRIDYYDHLGWPGILIDLGGTHDFTGGTLEFDVSFHNMHIWIGILLFDSEGNSFMNSEKGYDAQMVDGYRKVRILLEEMRTNANANFDLTKVGKIGFIFNTNDYQGATNPHNDKYVLLDNLTVKYYETVDEDLIHLSMDISPTAQDPKLDFEFVEEVVATPESRQALKASFVEGLKTTELWFCSMSLPSLENGILSAYFKFEGDEIPEIEVRAFREDWSGSERVLFTLELQENGWYYGTLDTSLMNIEETIRLVINFSIPELVVYMDQLQFSPNQ